MLQSYATWTKSISYDHNTTNFVLKQKNNRKSDKKTKVRTRLVNIFS